MSDPYSDLLHALDGEWRTARELADISGTGRRQAGMRLGRLVRDGLAEFSRTGTAPSPRSDPPPLVYRGRDWKPA